MEQMIATTGYLFFLYGAYLIASNYPADPVLKGAVLVAGGIGLIIIGYLLARRHMRSTRRTENQSWEFQ